VAAATRLATTQSLPAMRKTTFGGGGCGRDSPESGLELTDGKARHEVAEGDAGSQQPADNNAAREAKNAFSSHGLSCMGDPLLGRYARRRPRSPCPPPPRR